MGLPAAVRVLKRMTLMFNDYYIIDAHCHIYPEKIAERAVRGTGDFYGETMICKGTVSDLAVEAKAAGIDHCIVQSVATTPKQVKSINEFIAGEVKAAGGFFTGLGTLHPDSEDQKGDVDHLVELGLKGVKLHPDIQKFKLDDYRCLKIYELCEERGLTMLLHTGDNRYDYSNPNRLIPILTTYTNLTVIGAHFGGWSIWDEASRKLCGIENFYVDCSSSMPWLEPDTTREIIRRYGADRVLFGTDYPMWRPKDEIEAFLKLGLDENENRSILNMNAKKLFCLE